MSHDDDPTNRLAVYASLAPGQPNHHVLAPIRGTWTQGAVTGRVIPNAAYDEYPALVHDPRGELVPVHILTSTDLPNHWERLDLFEGPAYRRAVLPVLTQGGQTLHASAYVLAQPSP